MFTFNSWESLHDFIFKEIQASVFSEYFIDEEFVNFIIDDICCGLSSQFEYLKCYRILNLSGDSLSLSRVPLLIKSYVQKYFDISRAHITFRYSRDIWYRSQPLITYVQELPDIIEESSDFESVVSESDFSTAIQRALQYTDFRTLKKFIKEYQSAVESGILAEAFNFNPLQVAESAYSIHRARR